MTAIGRNDFAYYGQKARADGLNRSDLEALCAFGFVHGQVAPAMLKVAGDLKEAVFPGQLHLCAITSAKTGRCREDCAFCAQSVHHDTTVASHPLLDEQELLRRGRLARAMGIGRFSFVTSGGRLRSDELAVLVRVVQQLTGEGLGVDVSVGTMDAQGLVALRQAGVGFVHHNLETSPGFYPRVCTSHDWESRAEAIRRATEAGCAVCSGGIFGLGESWSDRIDLALQLRERGVGSVPLNFLNPIPGTPLADTPILPREEALAIIALFRFALPRANIRLAGGLQRVFGDDLTDIFHSGASGVMVGDYLTTPGMSFEDFTAKARSAGLTLV